MVATRIEERFSFSYPVGRMSRLVTLAISSAVQAAAY
jgi:hypothetical protein